MFALTFCFGGDKIFYIYYFIVSNRKPSNIVILPLIIYFIPYNIILLYAVGCIFNPVTSVYFFI